MQYREFAALVKELECLQSHGGDAHVQGVHASLSRRCLIGYWQNCQVSVLVSSTVIDGRVPAGTMPPLKAALGLWERFTREEADVVDGTGFAGVRG